MADFMSKISQVWILLFCWQFLTENQQMWINCETDIFFMSHDSIKIRFDIWIYICETKFKQFLDLNNNISIHDNLKKKFNYKLKMAGFDKKQYIFYEQKSCFRQHYNMYGCLLKEASEEKLGVFVWIIAKGIPAGYDHLGISKQI